MVNLLVSPWICADSDYLGNKIKLSFFFDDNSNFKSPGMTGTRDPGCVYTKATIGDTQGDGIILNFSDGDFNLSVEELSSMGLNSIYDITDSQFTLSK